MAQRIRALLLLCLVAGVSACTGVPNLAPPPYTAVPVTCPFDRVLMFNGDSVASEWANATTLAGYEVFNAAHGASGYVFELLPTIGERVRQWVELCGEPSAVILSGGGNDFGHGEYVSVVEAAATELAVWLRDRGIPTIWVTIYPFPERSPAYPLFDSQRRAYNSWLRSGGPGWGTVVDLDPVMGGDSLDPKFWTWASLTIPDVHPNAAGYAAGASAITQGIEEMFAQLN